MVLGDTSFILKYLRIHKATLELKIEVLIYLEVNKRICRWKMVRNFQLETILLKLFYHMLHLKDAGFDFNIVTPTGKPVVFEMWAMPS